MSPRHYFKQAYGPYFENPNYTETREFKVEHKLEEIWYSSIYSIKWFFKRLIRRR